jgi:hypothetical protein
MKAWSEKGGKKVMFPELSACYRREAIRMLAAGRLRAALSVLVQCPTLYKACIDKSGIIFFLWNALRTVMAALKVMVAALKQSGSMHEATQIQEDVEETDAILSGYWEGVLEETRWELREQQRAGGGGATKKSKSVKRKELKRKAQQRKKSEAVVAAATATGATHKEVVIQSQEEGGKQEKERVQEADRSRYMVIGTEEVEKNGQGQSLIASLVAMIVGEKKDEDEDEDEEN